MSEIEYDHDAPPEPSLTLWLIAAALTGAGVLLILDGLKVLPL